jgi:hypothetical protein
VSECRISIHSFEQSPEDMHGFHCRFGCLTGIIIGTVAIAELNFYLRIKRSEVVAFEETICLSRGSVARNKKQVKR